MPIFRSTLAAAASALVAVGLLVAPVQIDVARAATTSAPAAPPTAAAGTTSVTVTPTGQGVVGLGDDLSLSITVTNDTDTALPAGEAAVDMKRQPVGTRAILDDWIRDTSTDGFRGGEVASVAIPEVPAHRSVTVSSVTVGSDALHFGTLNPFGARLIAAAYSAGKTFAVGRSAFTWAPTNDRAPVDVAVAMPITVPASDSGLLTASALAAATALDGTLTNQLDAAEGHSVALGIDPRIIASIRVLGDDAPSSAVSWLARLEGLRNEKFPLAWADADVVGLHQAGADQVLTPVSLDQAVEPGRFPDATTPPRTPTPTPTDSPAPTDAAVPETTPTDTGTPTDGTGEATATTTDGAAPTDTATSTTLPTTQSLLDFPYTSTTIAWPTSGTVAADDLPALRAGGTRSTILASGNTSAGADTTVAASERIGADQALVADESMSEMLDTAATAGDATARSRALSRLTATLATASVQGTATGPVLLTLDRAWPTDSTRLDQVLDALEVTPWVAPTDLSTVVDAAPGSLTLQAGSVGDDRRDQLRRLVAADHDVDDFSTAVEDPTAVTAPIRLEVLAASSNAWRADRTGFAEAVRSVVTKATKTVSSVGIVDSSNITLLGDRSSLPVSVRNRSDYPVTVLLTVTPSNSFLRIEKTAVPVTIQPQSSTRTTVPVQSVANGKVELALSLTSTKGVRIAEPTAVEINVQAQWETVITALAGMAVVLVFGIGILRNVRRRIRRRRGELDPADDEDPNRLLDERPAATTVASAPADSDRSGGPAAAAGAVAAPAVLSSDTIDPQQHEDPTISATQPPAAAVDETQGDTRSLGRASAMLAAGTMISRLLGFAKTFVLAYAIGQANSRSADAFAVSNQLPNNIYALIAGGLLSAVLIPQIVRSMAHNSDGGRAYVNKIVTLGGTAFVVITVIATLLAPLLVHLYSARAADGKGFSPATTDLAVAFAFWCLPQILFYAVYSLLGEVLNAKQVFGPFTWAPLINNVIAIAGLVVFIALFGDRAVNADTADWTPMKIAVLAGSASLGVLAQAAFLPFFWKRAGLTFRPDFRWRGVGLKATGTAAGWLFAMILVTQLAGVVQSRVASLGSGNAGNAVLQNAWLLFMLPHSIIAVSIATAYFTRMSHDAERGDLAAVRRNLSLSLRIVGLFTVFSSVALMVVAAPFGRMFAADFDGAFSIGAVLLAYMPGLVLFSMLFIIQRVFWAMHDHRTPFLMQLVQSVLFVIGALAVTLLPGNIIGLALAACTTVAGSAQTVVALVVVRRRLDGIEGRIVTRSHLQFVAAAVVAGVVGFLVTTFFGGYSRTGFAMSDFTGAFIAVVLAGAVMVAVYFGALVLLKNGEIRSAVDMVKARLGR